MLCAPSVLQALAACETDYYDDISQNRIAAYFSCVHTGVHMNIKPQMHIRPHMHINLLTQDAFDDEFTLSE